jgi:hypothetical protein
MLLIDVEKLLGITVTEAQKPMYEARLEVAIDQASAYCKNDFKNDLGVVTIPTGAKMGIALMVKDMGEQKNVQSQSLGDMAKSFFQNGTSNAAMQFLKPYRKASFK